MLFRRDFNISWEQNCYFRKPTNFFQYMLDGCSYIAECALCRWPSYCCRWFRMRSSSVFWNYIIIDEYVISNAFKIIFSISTAPSTECIDKRHCNKLYYTSHRPQEIGPIFECSKLFGNIGSRTCFV